MGRTSAGMRFVPLPNTFTLIGNGIHRTSINEHNKVLSNKFPFFLSSWFPTYHYHACCLSLPCIFPPSIHLTDFPHFFPIFPSSHCQSRRCPSCDTPWTATWNMPAFWPKPMALIYSTQSNVCNDSSRLDTKCNKSCASWQILRRIGWVEIRREEGKEKKRMEEEKSGMHHNNNCQINRFWLSEMYLRQRMPLPLNFNPAYIFPRRQFRSEKDQLKSVSQSVGCSAGNQQSIPFHSIHTLPSLQLYRFAGARLPGLQTTSGQVGYKGK